MMLEALRCGGLLVSLQAALFLTCEPVGPAVAQPAPASGGSSAVLIDTHNHLFGRLPARGGGASELDYEGALRVALATMDELGIRRMVIMPPPQPPDMVNGYPAEDFTAAIARHRDRFSFLAGGGTLNVMIQEAVKAGRTDPRLRRRFEERAAEIVALGALGFGEMTAEHLSMNPRHPYVSAPPDHPLFLLLADLAARYDVPIDLHMEAIPADRALAARFRSPPNPKVLPANVAAFERLLAHNRKAKIIWVHAGWDNTGGRTVALCRELLARHSNLYMSIRVVPAGRLGGREPSLAENRLVDERGKAGPEWAALIRDFADRFLIGSDEFYLSPRMRRARHPSTGSARATVELLSQLPPDLARKVGYENARRVFKLGEVDQ
jgi:hypothetical protein